MLFRLAIVMLLNVMISPLLSAPAPEHQCTMLHDGRVRCDLPSFITAEMPDPTCQAQWSINGMSVANYESGDTDFVSPVIAATVESITFDRCPDQLDFYISCTKTGLSRKLPFSCQTDAPLSIPTGSSSGASIYTAPYMLLTTGIANIILLG